MLDELFDVFDRDRNGQRHDGTQPRKKGIRGFFARILGGGDHDDAPRNSESYAAPGRDRNRDDDEDDPRNDERYGRSRRQRRDRDDDGPDFGFD